MDMASRSARPVHSAAQLLTSSPAADKALRRIPEAAAFVTSESGPRDEKREGPFGPFHKGLETRASLLVSRVLLLVARKLLGAPGIATRRIPTTRKKKLLVTSASLLVTSALLVVTRSY